jgi:hypothetical protein
MKRVNSKDDEAPTSFSDYVIKRLGRRVKKITTMMRIGGGSHIKVSSMSDDTRECDRHGFHVGVGRKGEI